MPETETPDPGNASPDQWSEPLDPADLEALLDLIDNPDPLVVAGLAGTMYDPVNGTDKGVA